MRFVTDKKHLICVPYSIENLHKTAEEFKIDVCWFKKNHYFIGGYPEETIEEIAKKCKIVSQANIVEIIQSPEYAEIIISDEVQAGGANGNSHRFEATQIEIKGQNLKYN